MNLEEKISEFDSLIKDEVNEKVIVEQATLIRSELRTHWKQDKNQFTELQVESLKKLSVVLEALTIFIEEQEDFTYLSTKEEVDESINRLYHVVETVDGLKVAGRVNKEIRELLEKKIQLPHEAGIRWSAKLEDALRKLRRNSPTCSKCGKNMVLRDGPYSYFWGCSTFPTCFGRKQLTKDELAEIPE